MSNHIIYSRYFKLGEYFHLVKCVMEKYGIPISDQRSLICIMRGALSKNLKNHLMKFLVGIKVKTNQATK